MDARCIALAFASVVACGASPAAPTAVATRSPVASAAADPDRDHDGIPNECDVCPDEPETRNGVCDEDGCPDVPVDAFPRGVIVIRTVLLFDKQSTKLSALAMPLVEQVGANLLANKDALELVAVIGHASRDESQPDATAASRAEVVKRALLDRGVDLARLETHGAGARRAFDETETSLNRRVEFVVLRAEGREQARLNGDAITEIAGEAQRRDECRPPPPTCGDHVAVK